eukprot:1412983-Amphidinium_carterae.1
MPAAAGVTLATPRQAVLVGLVVFHRTLHVLAARRCVEWSPCLGRGAVREAPAAVAAVVVVVAAATAASVAVKLMRLLVQKL